ncbi:MAG: DUF1028 domain-containing protein [Candidatus Bathyarchaeota archaeon]|jgi:uncharacterized Ntn-hydrolase superfamily protein|nr:DUF1028 domain-containing protein [Candidatus Bathyarchaeota archaeon A05DMB-5]MDH7557128.1 DUF1028 domain-containing protein [Candidatus Bathyarchaeota archaeon]
MLPSTGTFSILAILPNHEKIGVATATGVESVGDRVPHAKPGVGVVATQAYTNVAYGIKGLEMLAKGFTPEETLKKLLAEDAENELRQVAIMNFRGEKAVFTGAKAPQWHGEIIGENYVVIGNLLAGKSVLASMAREFEHSSGSLAWRMANALKGGSESGGDRRGEISAALIIVSADQVEVNLRVDFHKNPIEELIRKLEAS